MKSVWWPEPPRPAPGFWLRTGEEPMQETRKIPRYELFAHVLEELIRSGTFPMGTRLPSIRESIAQHGVSFSTVPAGLPAPGGPGCHRGPSPVRATTSSCRPAKTAAEPEFTPLRERPDQRQHRRGHVPPDPRHPEPGLRPVRRGPAGPGAAAHGQAQPDPGPSSPGKASSPEVTGEAVAARRTCASRSPSGPSATIAT